MKNFHAAGAGLVLFAGGLLIGRELFPTTPSSPPPDDPPTLSSRVTTRSRIAETAAPPTKDTSDLLNLVNLDDPFNSARDLGKALEKLDSLQLRNLLADLERSNKDDPKFNTTRTQIFNHLALADPVLALEVLLAGSDDYFKQSHLSIAILQLAKSDFSAARLAVRNIADERLKNIALGKLTEAAMDFDPRSVPALMEEAQSTPATNSFLHNGWQNYGSWGSQIQIQAFDTNSPISRWAAKDFAAAEGYARGLKDSHQRQAALNSIASTRAATDPESALDWARGLADGKEREQSLYSVLQTISSKDPGKVAGLLDQVSNSGLKDALINNLARSWMNLDPAAGLAWIQNLPSSNAKHQALSSALQIVSQNDPRAGTALLEQLPANIRSQNLNQLAQTWAQKDFNAAKTWVTSLENPFDLKIGLQGILSTWALEDPTGAAAFIRNSDGLSKQDQTSQLTQLAGQWASKEPAAALQWARNLEDQDCRNNSLSNIFSQWASRDPEEAARQVTSLPDQGARQNALPNVISSWARQDPDAAIQWFDALPQKDRFANANTIINSLTSASPERAASWLDRLTTEAAGDEKLGAQLANSASSLASTWSNHDVEAAAAWATQLRDDSTRESALSEVARNWARMDPIEASGWIDNLTDGKARDAGVQTLVDQFKGIDPASAFDWAQTMSSDSGQASSLRSVLGDWVKSDENAARQAYANADLTQKQRDRIDHVLEQ